MAIVITRDRWLPPINLYDMVVLRMKTPTVTDTQAGVPPYAPANMRYWSICENELMSTSVVRCVADNQAATLDGFATFVISDPSKRPSNAVLSRWGATWLPWGALAPHDVIYSFWGAPLTSESGVFYYGMILYRQMLADPNFAQSIENIAKLPITQQREAMGDYWPQIGHCTAAAFEALGARCSILVGER